MISNYSGRTIGLLLTGCGLVLSMISMIFPLISAIQHKTEISFSKSAALGGPIAIFLGFPYVVFGQKAVNLFGLPSSPSKLGWIYNIAAGCVGFFVFWRFKLLMNSYGYFF